MSKVKLSERTIEHAKKMQAIHNWNKFETFEYAKKYQNKTSDEIREVNSVRIEAWKEHFYTFVKDIFPLVRVDEIMKKHPNTAILCDNLQAMAFGDYKGVKYNIGVVNCSRGAGKSLFTTVLFPCWLVLRDPSIKILVSSISSDLNLGWHQQRMIFLEKLRKLGLIKVVLKPIIAGRPYVTLTNKQNGKIGRIDTTTTYSTTVGGTYDIIIMDDPETLGAKYSPAEQEAFKHHMDAVFPMLRNVEIDEGNTLYFEQINESQIRQIKINKKLKKAKELQKVDRVVIVVQQRVYVGDVTDRILAIAKISKQKSGQNYLHLILPGWWESDVEYVSPLSGEIIFSATMAKNGKNGKIYNQMGALSEAYIEGTSAQIGPDETAAQIQQAPIEGSSQCFSYEAILDWKPEDLMARIRGQVGGALKVRRMCVMTDFAFTANSTSDYTVMLAYLECEEEVFILGEKKTLPCIYILDMYRARTNDLNSLGQHDLMTFIQAWSQNDYYMGLCEKKTLTLFMTREAGHMTMINEFQKTLRGDSRYVFEIIDRRGKKKEERIYNSNIIHRVNYGGLHVPHKDYESIITRCTQALTTKKDKQLRYVDIAHQIKTEFRNFRLDGSHSKLSHDDIIDCVADIFVEAYKPKKLPFVEAMKLHQTEKLAKMQAK